MARVRGVAWWMMPLSSSSMRSNTLQGVGRTLGFDIQARQRQNLA